MNCLGVFDDWFVVVRVLLLHCNVRATHLELASHRFLVLLLGLLNYICRDVNHNLRNVSHLPGRHNKAILKYGVYLPPPKIPHESAEKYEISRHSGVGAKRFVFESPGWFSGTWETRIVPLRRL